MSLSLDLILRSGRLSRPFPFRLYFHSPVSFLARSAAPRSRAALLLAPEAAGAWRHLIAELLRAFNSHNRV